jgi:hypothetical protein
MTSVAKRVQEREHLADPLPLRVVLAEVAALLRARREANR